MATGPMDCSESPKGPESSQTMTELHRSEELSVAGPSNASRDVVKSKPLLTRQSAVSDSAAEYAHGETTHKSGQVTTKYVAAKVRQFKKRFKDLKKTMKENLKRCDISVGKVTETLKSLSADDSVDHKLFSEAHLDVFDQAMNTSMLLGQLDFNMDYLSYHLLDYLAVEFDLREVLVKMEYYKSDLQKFTLKIPLTLFAREQKKKMKLLPGFEELNAELDLSVCIDHNVEVMEQFRREYTTHYGLKDYSMMVAHIIKCDSTLTCSWFVPQSVVDKLKKNLPRNILAKHGISVLRVAGTCVYRSRQGGATSMAGDDSSAASKPISEDDYPFVEEPSEDFFCPVTMGLLLQPHLTSCCGQHISQEAVKRLKKEGQGCPMCKSDKWPTILSKHFLRQVTELRVFCRETECDWQGELSELESHSESCHNSSDPTTQQTDEVSMSMESSSSSSAPGKGPVPTSPSKKPVSNILKQIRMLREKFHYLKKGLVISMEKRRVPLELVVDTLKSLPADDTKGHPLFTESQICLFSEAFDHTELLGALGFHMNYLSCPLLEYFVNEFDLEEVKMEMEDYKSALQQFRMKTPVKTYCQVQQKRNIKPPPNFKMLASAFMSDDMMLEHVERFQKEYSYHYGLQNITMTLAKIDVDPITVSWFIPESVSKELIATRRVPRKILSKYSVLTLEVDGGRVYLYHTKEKQRIPAAASTSTSSASAASVGATYSHPSTKENDYQFVEKLSKDYLCPVTQCLLLHPHLTSCCGQHISATRLQRDGNRCPLCKAERWSTILDKRFQREVKTLQVFCSNKERGCEWQGELFSRDYHLQSCSKRPPPTEQLPPLKHQGFEQSKNQEVTTTEEQSEPVPEADTEKSDKSDLTEAVSSGVTHEVELLLSRGADPNEFSLTTESSPLMEASSAGNVEMVRLLLHHGANPNLPHPGNWNVILEAANNGHVETVDVLLERGANPDTMSDDRWSPLMAVVFKNYDDIALRLIRGGATPHLQDKNQTNAILLAVERHKHDTVVNALLDHVDDSSQLDIQDSGGKTALTFACMQRKLTVVRRLLHMKADPNIPNNEGETPLMIARKLGEGEIERVLLENGANSDMEEMSDTEYATEKSDKSDLTEAVSSGVTHEVELLLSRGADPNEFSLTTESSPLMEASSAGNVEMVRLLLDHGANPNLQHPGNWNVILEAANNGLVETVDVLLERGANPDSMSDDRWSPLMAAVFKNYDDIALRLIRAGATPHLQDKNQTSAILLAVERHKHDTVVNALLEHVDDPSQLDVQDSGGKTALTFACMQRKLTVVRRLLNMKADPNVPNNEGETPVMIARALGEGEIEKVLLENGANSDMEKMSDTDTHSESVSSVAVEFEEKQFPAVEGLKRPCVENEGKMPENITEKEARESVEEDMEFEQQGENEGEREKSRKRTRVSVGKGEREVKKMKAELQQEQVRTFEEQSTLVEVERREHEMLTFRERAIAAEPQASSLEEREGELEEITAEETVILTNEEQHIDWEGYGLRLHIHKDSLPEGCSELPLKRAVKIVKNYKLPMENCILVSAVYSFSHNLGERNLRQHATLEMQHCVVSGSNLPLSIVKCDYTTPPYQFRILPGGHFETDGYGRIKVDTFSFYAIIMWINSLIDLFSNVRFSAILYYTNIRSCQFDFNLYITKHLDALLKEIDRDVKRGYGACQKGSTSHFKFQEEESAVCLDLPQCPISGWTMKHLNQKELERDNVIHDGPSIPFQVRVSWNSNEGHHPQTLEYELKKFKLLLVSPERCTVLCLVEFWSIYPHFNVFLSTINDCQTTVQCVTSERGQGQSTTLCPPPHGRHSTHQAPSRSNTDGVSVESRALRRGYSMILRCGDPDYLEQTLYSELLLTPTEKEKATQKTLTSTQKLEQIFNGLERRVRSAPDRFHTVVDIFNNEPALNDVGKRLSDLYEEELQEQIRH